MEFNSKIAVFGAGGLIGSEIVEILKGRSYGNVLPCRHEELELENQMAVNKYFEIQKPDFVFFCAVRSVTDFESNKCIDASEMYSNIMMQLNVMEAARNHHVKKAIFLGSAMLYPWNNEHENEKLQENLLCDFRINQYRESMKSTVLSKFVSMKMCEYYHRQYGSRFLYVIPTHIYGRLHNRKNLYFLENLVIDLCKAKTEGIDKIKMNVFGEGKAKKQILHVNDCADAIITLMNKYEEYSEPVNIGTEEYESWSTIIEKICRIIDYDGEVIFNSERQERLENRLCSIDKLLQLGWKPKIDMDTGLRELCAECMECNRRD